MLFYGPSGAGKKTRISCTLRQLFGPGVEKVWNLEHFAVLISTLSIAQN